MVDPPVPAQQLWANAYLRRPNGTWVYASDGTPVPGATDLLRSELHQVHHIAGQVFVPSHDPALDPDLQAWLHRRGLRDDIPGLGSGVLVPAEEWAEQDVWVGMHAPELHLWAVLTLRDVSQLAGYSESTLRVHRSRGVLVGPQRTVGRTPLWARPVIQRWLLDRETGPGTVASPLVAEPSPPEGALTDQRATEVVLGAVRAMFGCDDAEEIAAILVQTAHRLGGRIVEAEHADARAIPVNLALGRGEPLLAVPDPTRPRAGLHLHAHLPRLVEDARHAIARLDRRAGLAVDAAADAAVDALTGLPDRRAYDRLAGRLREGTVLVLVDLEELTAINDVRGRAAGDQVLRAFGAVLVDHTRVSEPVIRFGDDEFLVVFSGGDSAEVADGDVAAERFLERVRLAWRQRRPAPIDFAAGVAVVTTRVDAALEVAERSLSDDKRRRQTIRRGDPDEPEPCDP